VRLRASSPSASPSAPTADGAVQVSQNNPPETGRRGDASASPSTGRQGPGNDGPGAGRPSSTPAGSGQRQSHHDAATGRHQWDAIPTPTTTASSYTGFSVRCDHQPGRGALRHRKVDVKGIVSRACARVVRHRGPAPPWRRHPDHPDELERCRAPGCYHRVGRHRPRGRGGKSHGDRQTPPKWWQGSTGVRRLAPITRGGASPATTSPWRGLESGVEGMFPARTGLAAGNGPIGSASTWEHGRRWPDDCAADGVYEFQIVDPRWGDRCVGSRSPIRDEVKDVETRVTSALRRVSGSSQRRASVIMGQGRPRN